MLVHSLVRRSQRLAHFVSMGQYQLQRNLITKLQVINLRMTKYSSICVEIVARKMETV